MITISGQLAIKTIPGRYGNFNVGRLSTSIGEFVTKGPELEQHRAGKYQGEFTITQIKAYPYSTAAGVITEVRAYLAGMTLSNADALTADEATRMSTPDVDPLDEENNPPAPVFVAAPVEAKPASSECDPLVDTTPFRVDSSKTKSKRKAAEEQDDVAMFGPIWPLGQTVKLDSTVDRRLLRQQSVRLDQLGYEFAPLSQDWHLKAA